MLLDVAERLLLLDVLSRASGNLATLRVVRDLQHDVGFTDDENQALAFQYEGSVVRWQSGAAQSREFKISRSARDVVLAAIKKLDRDEALTLAHLAVFEKLGEEK